GPDRTHGRTLNSGQTKKRNARLGTRWRKRVAIAQEPSHPVSKLLDGTPHLMARVDKIRCDDFRRYPSCNGGTTNVYQLTQSLIGSCFWQVGRNPSDRLHGEPVPFAKALFILLSAGELPVIAQEFFVEKGH